MATHPIGGTPTGRNPQPVPSSTQYGAAIGSTTTSMGGAKRPQVTGKACDPPERSSRNASLGVFNSVSSKIYKGFGKVAPRIAPSTGSFGEPLGTAARETEAGLHDIVGRMFGTAGTAAPRELSTVILQCLPSQDGSAKPCAAAYRLATALSRVCSGDHAQAIEVVQNLRGQNETPAVFEVQRLLARTDDGRQALGRLSNLAGPQLESRCELLQVAGDLEGGRHLDMTQLASADQLAEAVRTRVLEWKLNDHIGGDNDAAAQLLGKAVLYLDAKTKGQPLDAADVAPHYAAYVAWRMNSAFVTSEANSQFHSAVSAMFKMVKYLERADHGPRTVRNLARDAATAVAQMFGKQKSPLSMTRFGTNGGDKWTLMDERDRFLYMLNDNIDTLRHHVDLELRRPDVCAHPDALARAFTRAALLDVWKTTPGLQGRVDVQVRRQTVAERATAMHAGMNWQEMRLQPASLESQSDAGKQFWNDVIGSELSQVAKVKTLRKRGDDRHPLSLDTLASIATRLAPADTGRSDIDATTSIEDLRMEAYGLAKLAARTPQQEQRLGELRTTLLSRHAEMIEEARQTMTAESPHTPLFQWSDLWNMFGDPRDGPTADSALRVLRGLMNGVDESMTSFSSGAKGMLGFSPALPLRVAGAAGVPVVLPSFGYSPAITATVTAGDTFTGGRLGVQTSKGHEVRAGIGAAVGFNVGWGVAAAFGSAGISASKTRASGGVLTTRNDKEGWGDKDAEVLQFFRDMHQEAGGRAKPANRAEMWERIVERFGDDPIVRLAPQATVTTVLPAASVTIGATVRASVGHNNTLGPVVTAGVNAVRSSTTALAGAGGDPSVSFRRNELRARVGTGIALGLPAIPAQESNVSAAVLVPTLAGAAAEKILRSRSGIIVFGRDRDGRIKSDLVQWVTGFETPKTAEEYFNGTPPGAERSRYEQWVAATAAGQHVTQDEARRLMDEFIAEMHRTPLGGQQMFGDRHRLMAAAAEKFNDVEEDLKTLQGPEPAGGAGRQFTAWETQEIGRLEAELRSILEDQTNWEPVAAYGADNHGLTRSLGANLLVAATGSVNAIDSARLTSVFVSVRDLAPEPNPIAVRRAAAARFAPLAQPQAGSPAGGALPGGGGHSGDDEIRVVGQT